MKWADVLLRLLLPARDRDTISGDLLEEYREDILPAKGPFRARLWYARQVLGFASPLNIGLAIGTVIGVLNLVDTAIEPLADDTPGGMLLFISPMLLAWFVVALSAVRRSGRFRDAVKTGILVAAATMIVFHLAGIVRVNLFLDVIRDRDDWRNLLARFSQSGFHSLRAYANYEYVRGAPLIVLVGALAGAVSGAAGGAVGRAIGTSPSRST